MTLAPTTLHTLKHQIKYIHSLSFPDYFSIVEDQHPELAETFDFDRLDTWIYNRRYDSPGDIAAHAHGRGDTYRAQRFAQPLSRPNVRELIEFIEQDSPRLVVDILGGNGHLSRVRNLLSDSLSLAAPYIITSDLDGDQIRSALDMGLPSIRQPAQETLFLSDTFDAVVFAYGTHHIPVLDRTSAWTEARRILKPGGRVVIQDYAIGTPTVNWYSRVIGLGAIAGHEFEHFTEAGLLDDLNGLGFSDVRACYMDDSFVSHGDTGQDALVAGIQHIVALYGLVKLVPLSDKAEKWLELLDELSHYFTIPADIGGSQLPRSIMVRAMSDGGFEAVFPRVALVVTGLKTA